MLCFKLKFFVSEMARVAGGQPHGCRPADQHEKKSVPLANRKSKATTIKVYCLLGGLGDRYGGEEVSNVRNGRGNRKEKPRGLNVFFPMNGGKSARGKRKVEK